MPLLSVEFALLFTLFFALYWSVNRRVQNGLLIVAALLFMASWSPAFVGSLLFAWAVAQICALIIYYQKMPKKLALWLGIVLLVGQLAAFKYINLLIDGVNASGILARIDSSVMLTPLAVVLPLGISFYTFQAISYLVDVYKGETAPLPNSVLLGVLSFVPTVMAGPIFQPKHAKRQWLGVEGGRSSETLKNSGVFKDNSPKDNMPHNAIRSSTNLATPQTHPSKRTLLHPYWALGLIMLAMLKKIVLAGQLETAWVNPIFANPAAFNGVEVLTGIYAYSLQLFLDFSGYTDLVIAIALLLGFRLPQNFNQPYLAADIQDFWARWHITLSSWIKEYLYIPLGGSRVGFWRTQINLLTAFAISGVWHGAGANFLLWGVLHGLALIWLNFNKRWGVRGWLTNKARPIAIFITFHYVALGWVFFRSENFAQAWDMLGALVRFDVPFSTPAPLILVAFLLLWLGYPYLKSAPLRLGLCLSKLPFYALPLVIAAWVYVLFLGAPEGLPNFIYANF